MEPSQRIVVTTPLPSLWDDGGTLNATRGRDLGLNEIRVLIRRGKLRFVVANVGSRLRWIDENDRFTFWKSELQNHLAAPGQRVALDGFPGSYCYFASEWTDDSETPIVLLEMSH